MVARIRGGTRLLPVAVILWGQGRWAPRPRMPTTTA